MKKTNDLLNKEEKMDVLLPLWEDLHEKECWILDEQNISQSMVVNDLHFELQHSNEEVVYEALNGEKRIIKLVYSRALELNEILVSLPNVDTNTEYPVYQYVTPQHVIDGIKRQIETEKINQARCQMFSISNALRMETRMNLEIMDELSEHKQKMVRNKLALIDEIKNEFITDGDKAKKCIQLIELMYEWSIDNPCDVEHVLHFDNGTIEIHSNAESRSGKWIMDYKNDELYLDGEVFFSNSVSAALNFIEAELLIHHV
ncbi:hypothetical protein [Bacillus thuringiensis]|uniref:hypothetical protein n=1 Tax=Bacillus thuringiensis TaxID=1428 RepID=UPI001875CFC9|nr:hypothetical protein [Bacillus thuringiensis]MBE5096469.1 hypothetical protein [Bacillus thuringiensis]